MIIGFPDKIIVVMIKKKDRGICAFSPDESKRRAAKAEYRYKCTRRSLLDQYLMTLAPFIKEILYSVLSQ